MKKLDSLYYLQCMVNVYFDLYLRSAELYLSSKDDYRKQKALSLAKLFRDRRDSVRRDIVLLKVSLS